MKYKKYIALITLSLGLLMLPLLINFFTQKQQVLQSTAANVPTGWISLGMEGIDVGAIAVSPDFASDHTLFINSSEGIFKSINAGKTWVKLTNGLPDNSGYSSSYSSIAISPNYAVDETIFTNVFSSIDEIPTGVFRSQNGGKNWERVNIYLEEYLAAQIAFSPDYKNDHTIFVGGHSFLAKSTNDGSTWQFLNPLPNNSSLDITDFAFSPSYVTDQTVFATGAGDILIFKSIDRGVTWSLSTPPFSQPGLGAWAVAVSFNFASDHTVFVGTDAVDGLHNLIKSIDGGVTWQPSGIGIPVTDIQDIVISPDDILYAGAGGNGAFISTNSGGSWQSLDDFPSSDICGLFYSLAVSPQYATDGTVFAGCNAYPYLNIAGAWKHVLSKSPDRDDSLLSPFNNGMTWTVSQGYLNNRNQTLAGCHIGTGPDHCRNQLFGLDMVPDQQNDTDILAPGNGIVAFRGKLEDEDCIGLRITLDNGLNMNVCHFASFNVNQGERVVQGRVLGIRSTPHVHLSLDDRYRIGTLCSGKERCFLPVPFDGQHTIEGVSFDPNPNGETVLLPYPLCNERKVDCRFEVDFQQYQGTFGTSTNVAIP